MPVRRRTSLFLQVDGASGAASALGAGVLCGAKVRRCERADQRLDCEVVRRPAPCGPPASSARRSQARSAGTCGRRASSRQHHARRIFLKQRNDQLARPSRRAGEREGAGATDRFRNPDGTASRNFQEIGAERLRLELPPVRPSPPRPASRWGTCVSQRSDSRSEPRRGRTSRVRPRPGSRPSDSDWPRRGRAASSTSKKNAGPSAARRMDFSAAETSRRSRTPSRWWKAAGRRTTPGSVPWPPNAFWISAPRRSRGRTRSRGVRPTPWPGRTSLRGSRSLSRSRASFRTAS